MDKRLNAYRNDIADIKLKDIIKADKYSIGEKYQAAVGLTALYAIPDTNSPMVSQLLYGEFFNVFDIKDGWAWGQSYKDGYVGYCSLNSLTPDLHEPTHHVSALSSHIYPEPNLKSAPVDLVHMMSDVSVINQNQENGFVPLADGNWIYATHIAGDFGTNPVSEALKFLYTPYLWGGRSNAGIDCSGLVQLAFASVGVSIPRDTDLQEADFGVALDEDQIPRHGDIAFFPGHVGIMLDDMHLLHANAHHMRVSIDPLREVIDIVSFQTDKPPLSSIKRSSLIF
ncbi:MAG: C40 family peptidase [Kordiimonadaceae bacterium]|nr:C40 family peptidase [Kordiimonadaceae bacterium]